jgi:hypothetical protein
MSVALTSCIVICIFKPYLFPKVLWVRKYIRWFFEPVFYFNRCWFDYCRFYFFLQVSVRPFPIFLATG